jgi:hypothetical protein
MKLNPLVRCTRLVSTVVLKRALSSEPDYVDVERVVVVITRP